MAHKWEVFYESSPAGLFRGQQRRCLHCGAVQERVADHAWGRVVSRSWQPRVGRCQAAPSEQHEEG